MHIGIWLQIWTKYGGDELAFYISIYLLLALLASICLGWQIWSVHEPQGHRKGFDLLNFFLQVHSLPHRTVNRSQAPPGLVGHCDEVRQLSLFRTMMLNDSEIYQCRAPQIFFSTTNSGTILNRFSQDMSLIEGTLPAGMLQTLSSEPKGHLIFKRVQFNDWFQICFLSPFR